MRNPLSFSLLILLSLAAAPAAGADPPRPHIVLLLADDLGWGDVGYHGGRVIETPTIDRLAEQNVRLEQFYVQPVCSPTRAALMTGRYPMRYGLQCGVIRPWARHGLPLGEELLPERLQEAGYVTAIVGKWHLGHLSRHYLPTQRGFDLQFGHYNGALDYFTHVRDGGLDWHRNDKVLHEEGYATELIAREAVRILGAHDQSKPLFLYVPFNAPHTPLQAPQKYIDKYADVKNKQRRIYAAMVHCLDKAIGDILFALGDHGYKNTLILFCSDNGGIPRLGSNGPLRSGKTTLYEGGVRVPAVAAWPGRLKRGAVNEPIHITDLVPTLTKLARARMPRHRDGYDVWPVIADGQPSPRKDILHNVTPFHGALREGNWKLIHNGHVGANATAPAEDEKWELFNLKDDPGEARDLHQQETEVFQRMKKRLAVLANAAAPAKMPPNKAPSDFAVPAVWGEP